MSTADLAMEMTSAGSFNYLESSFEYYRRMGNDMNSLSCNTNLDCDFLAQQGQLESLKESLEKSLGNSDPEDIIRNSKTFEELFAIADQIISTEMAERLYELYSQPYEPEEGEKPLNLESARDLLLYCVKRGIEGRPILSATPTGLIQADWRRDKDNRFSIRFFPEGKAWVAVRTPDESKSKEVLFKDLLCEHSIFQVPEWA